ncbi:sulfite oxidase-like oxidoreductase [Meiothermus sp.]|jgi:DMSO/TMAO reductase YedYZ molybdopterin-dependent catalytic subunit|uniref:sulfite oxidase-like oxidoreductase n=1 Tax=Meiothermus sp. TaxID=1955249 RepID=UPI0021DEAFD9|nr:sulfite oxidase-like oxidoreductase [Meiothermus sp.]GIW24568.1 MAG: sulfite oxidase-like oxidoreductase [Meiothermus sp.]
MFGNFFKPKSVDTERVPPGQVLTEKFPVLTYGPTPTVRPEEVRLEISGQVEEPQTLSWAELMSLPQSDLTADFHCVTRWSKLDVKWSGIRVPDLMRQVRLKPQARAVLVHCYGGYTTNLTLDDFLLEQNLLAHTLFGQPLPREHGGPLRLVVPHLYAWKSAKWVRGLQFLDREELGFWEVNGYHRRGDPWKEERFSD